MAGPDARPRDDQAAAVHALVVDRARTLVVQATGWGKSAVYWAATRALRDDGAGATLVVSPLLALMRDQVAAAGRAGLVAETLNSTNVEDWDRIMTVVDDGTLDVLLVSPERLANPSFAGRLSGLLGRCGLVVIDEAHCLSDWGFDFRPDYQRLGRTLCTVDAPVLATTATANRRVTDDVADQLGDGTRVFRGTLARASLRLAVLGGLGPLERYAWVADTLPGLDGSGIVYVPTVAETERLAGFLAERGLAVGAYSSALDPDRRAGLEQDLRANRVKALVATSALGMGFDKPDLGFVVHVGSPSSPVAYYQQVGRAGRAIDDAVAVLLPAENDEALWRYFATAGVPRPDQVERLLGSMGAGPVTVPALETATGLRRGRIEALLKLLAVDGAVERRSDGWSATGAGWHYDEAKWQALARVREAEADLMRAYAAGAGCLMAYLQQALDDPDPRPCGRCSVCRPGTVVPVAVSAETVAAARTALRGRDVVLEPRKRWPAGTGRSGAIRAGGPGRALAFGDDPAWVGVLPDPHGPDGPYDREVLDGMVEVLRRFKHHWAARPVAVVAIPSRRHPQRVASLAGAVAAAGRLPVVDLVELHGPGPAGDTASGATVRALGAMLRLRDGAPVPDGPVLLVDDTWRSGWTMTVAGALLRDAGASVVIPLVAHQLP